MTLLSPLPGTLSPLGVSAGRRRGVQSEFCLGFDGVDSYVDCGTDASLAITGELSVCMWMRHAPVTTTFNSALVANAQALSSECNYVTSFSFASAGCVDFWNHFGGPSLTSIGRVDNGAWHHVVFTRTGSAGAWTLSVYIDGRLDKTVAAAINPQNPVTPATAIGRLGGYDGYYFGGQLDDVRIYSRALTADEISAIYVNTTPPPTDGLVAYFPLEEGTGTTTTDTVAGLVGTLVGGPTWQPQTPPRLIAGRNTEEWSVSFDGVDDWVDCGTGLNAILADGPLTISAWFKTDTVAAGAREIVANSDGANQDFALLINNTAGKVSFLRSSFAVSVTGNTSLVAGVWYHAVVTVSGSVGNWTCTLFLNGREDGSAVDTNNPNATGGTTAIGKLGAHNLFFFSGLIDDVRIYNAALSAASVAILARGKEPTETPVARWRLNEGTGTNAADSIGSNHGTLTNGPTWSGDVCQHFRQVIESSQALSVANVAEYVSFSDSGFPTGSAARSISLWLKTTQAGEKYFFGYGTLAATQSWFFGLDNTNQLSITQNGAAVSIATVVNDGIWHHVVVTWSGTTVRLYVDGVLRGSGTFTVNTVLGSGSIGRIIDSSYAVIGSIDDVLVHGIALPDAAIADQAAGFLVPAGLVSRYKLDNSAVDSVGTNHGTENGGVGYSASVPGTL